MIDRNVVSDPAAVVAERIAVVARAGGHIALTGGSTPNDAYRQAAAIDTDWSRATLWFGDERCVPPDDERSNYGMARDALLARIDGPAPSVRRMRGELGPHEGARAYEAELQDAFGKGMPAFDLVLLGLGSDAHCASLFPDAPALAVRDRAVVGVEQARLEPLVSRVTLTLPALNAGREIIFLVTGADKAAAVARAFGGEPRPDAPASLVAPVAGTLTLVADSDAAALLSAGSRS